VNEKPYVIGIAGPSCAGKTALAQHLATSHEHALVFALDNYYRNLSDLPPSARADHNFDVPEALDDGLLLGHLRALVRGEAVDTPVYDFSTHCRRPETTRIGPGRVVLVEGLFALYWGAARGLMHLKVFVEAPEDVILARRTARDVRERGRTPDSVQAQYARTVRPMYERYALPTRRFADLVLDGTEPVDALARKVLAEGSPLRH